MPFTTLRPKPPKRFKRTKMATAITRELLLQNVPIKTVAERVQLSEDTFRRLYRPELDEFGLTGSGKRAHVPTEQTVKQARMCGVIGLSHTDVKRILGVSQDAYDACYREVVEDGRSEGKKHVAAEMYRKATKQSDSMPNVTAGIFWLKAKADWKEAEKVEISGPDGGPIQTQTAVVVIPANGRDKLTDNQEPLTIEHDGTGED